MHPTESALRIDLGEEGLVLAGNVDSVALGPREGGTATGLAGLEVAAS